MLRLPNFRCSFCSNPLDETHLSLRASERLNGSPSERAPLTPPALRERLHLMAQRFAVIPPHRALRTLAPAPLDGCTHSPSLRIRSQARCSAPCLQDTDSSGQPSFLRFPKRIILLRSCRYGEGRTARHGSLPSMAAIGLLPIAVKQGLLSREPLYLYVERGIMPPY